MRYQKLWRRMSASWPKGKIFQNGVVPRGTNLQLNMRARISETLDPRITHIPDSTYWVPFGQEQGSVALIEQSFWTAWASVSEAKRPRALNYVKSFIVEATREYLSARSNPARKEPVPVGLYINIHVAAPARLRQVPNWGHWPWTTVMILPRFSGTYFYIWFKVRISGLATCGY